MRTHGHRAARIDPLDLLQRDEVAALDPARYGLNDITRKYNVDGIIWTKLVGSVPERSGEESGGIADESSGTWWTLGDITRHLRSVYVGRIAYEYMHSPSKSERLWFSHFLESQFQSPAQAPLLSRKEKIGIHGLLARSEVFDNFLQLKFPHLKRYGLEGGESMLPAIDTLFCIASRG
jgi:probable 2-oxoglutarate dehydrogenase E1 component DHKTD1